MCRIPSHAGLRPRISIRGWPITGSRSTESLALILTFIGLAPSCGRQRGKIYVGAGGAGGQGWGEGTVGDGLVLWSR